MALKRGGEGWRLPNEYRNIARANLEAVKQKLEAARNDLSNAREDSSVDARERIGSITGRETERKRDLESYGEDYESFQYTDIKMYFREEIKIYFTSFRESFMINFRTYLDSDFTLIAEQRVAPEIFV